MIFAETWNTTPDSVRKTINHDDMEEMEASEERKLLESIGESNHV